MANLISNFIYLKGAYMRAFHFLQLWITLLTVKSIHPWMSWNLWLHWLKFCIVQDGKTNTYLLFPASGSPPSLLPFLLLVLSSLLLLPSLPFPSLLLMFLLSVTPPSSHIPHLPTLTPFLSSTIPLYSSRYSFLWAYAHLFLRLLLMNSSMAHPCANWLK